MSLLKLCLAGSMDNLVVVLPSFGFVGEETAKLGEQSLPVAGNILHPQVVEDEILTPVGTGGNRKSD